LLLAVEWSPGEVSLVRVTASKTSSLSYTSILKVPSTVGYGRFMIRLCYTAEIFNKIPEGFNLRQCGGLLNAPTPPPLHIKGGTTLPPAPPAWAQLTSHRVLIASPRVRQSRLKETLNPGSIVLKEASQGGGLSGSPKYCIESRTYTGEPLPGTALKLKYSLMRSHTDGSSFTFPATKVEARGERPMVTDERGEACLEILDPNPNPNPNPNWRRGLSRDCRFDTNFKDREGG